MGTGTEPTVKDQILHALSTLPEDADFEDAMECILFLYKLDQRLRELDEDNGSGRKTLSHEEVIQQMAIWLK